MNIYIYIYIYIELVCVANVMSENLVKIKKPILFGPKYSNLGILIRIFWKQMSDLKSAPSKLSTGKISLRLESYTFWTKMTIFGDLGSDLLKTSVRF